MESASPCLLTLNLYIFIWEINPQSVYATYFFKGNQKNTFLINVPLYDVGLMTANFHPNLISLSCSLLNIH